MAESQLGRQLGSAVQSPLADAAAYLALITQNNPLGSADQLLHRPDVEATLREALDEAQANAEAYIEQAWLMSGADEEHALYSRLLADVARQFGQLAHLHGMIRHAHASVPRREFVPGADEPGFHPSREAADRRSEAVRRAVLDWGLRAATRARMTLSSAEGFGSTAAVLEAALEREAAGERLRKRWRRNRHANSCLWCRRLDWVTIPLRASFAPYLGGPAVLAPGAARRVATRAGAVRYKLPVGAPIIRTHPPRLYHGDLQGPLLHPFCECRLEIVRMAGGPAVPSGSGQEVTRNAGDRSPAPQVTGGFLAASDVRAMPEDQYEADLALLLAAAGELDRVLRRLAEGR
jgi:hypothetical protein